MNAYLVDDYGFKWNLGNTTSGLYNIPFYESCKISIKSVIDSVTTISGNSTKEFEFDSGTVSSNNGTFYPYMISGFDLTADVGIYIQKMYVEAGSRLIKVRLANMSSSSKSVTRLNIRIVYHLRYNEFIRN